jgi:hypothetical protein
MCMDSSSAARSSSCENLATGLGGDLVVTRARPETGVTSPIVSRNSDLSPELLCLLFLRIDPVQSAP